MRASVKSSQLAELSPHLGGGGRKLRKRSIVLDDKVAELPHIVGACLGVEEATGGLPVQAPKGGQALEQRLPGGIHQHHAVKLAGRASLKKERDFDDDRHVGRLASGVWRLDA